MADHRLIDERSLAFGHAIAAHVAGDPSLINRARGNLAHWMQTASPGVMPDLAAWSAALEGPVEEVIRLLTGRDEQAIRLRQSNPFAGVLSQEERSILLKRFREHDPSAA